MIFLAWCFFLHFLADFPLQSRWMAENKSRLLSAWSAHIGVVTLVFLVGTQSPALALANAAIHGLIDGTIWNVYKALRAGDIQAAIDHEAQPEFEFWKDSLFWTTLGVDQLLHALTIIGLVAFL